MKLVIASNNAHKVKEIKEILGGFFEEILTMKDVGVDIEIEETGKTFEENSLLKAETVARVCGYASLADDSGLCVDALGGEPGIYSARYAGEEQNDDKNMDKLLSAMNGKADRRAKFVTVITLYFPDGRTVTSRGETRGEITLKREGSRGFGYDPVFFSYELGKTFGEASEEEKNSVSHRGKALEKLKLILSE